MKNHLFFTTLALISLWCISAWAEMSPKEIVDKAIEVNERGLKKGKIKLRLVIAQSGATRERVVVSKAMTQNGLDRVKVQFIEPADVKGTTLLMIEQGGDQEDLQYLFLPSRKKTKRISGSNKDAKFVGTDFTYADLENYDLKKGEYKKLADQNYKGTDCYQIEIVPKNPDDFFYSKVVGLIDKQTFVPLKMDFFDKTDGALLKILTVKKVEELKGNIIITKAVMENVKEGSSTTMTIESYEPEATFDASEFDKENIEL